MTKNIFKSLLVAFVCGFYGFVATAAVSLFSDYGQIQNVQNYSSNPFWSPNSPYNQRLPQPVYATGADLNADDCINVVQSLVSVQCMARDNCKNTDLSDVRPTIMVQLSNLPGANYVSACSGYIDGIFESYKQYYGNTLPNRQIAFPEATTPNTTIDDSNGIKFENPYKQQPPTKWQLEQKERSDELQKLQAQNGVGSEHLTKTNFPATYADLSFKSRMESDRENLMPYKDSHPYRTLEIKGKKEWCKDHPDDAMCKQKTNEPAQQPEEKEYDICEKPTATLCMIPNGNQYSCVDGDTTTLKQQVKTPLQWGVVFSYGTILGTSMSKKTNNTTNNNIEYECLCKITSMIPINQSAKDINGDYVSLDFVVLPSDYNSNEVDSVCTQQCAYYMTKNYNRDKLFGQEIPHTSHDDCPRIKMIGYDKDVDDDMPCVEPTINDMNLNVNAKFYIAKNTDNSLVCTAELSFCSDVSSQTPKQWGVIFTQSSILGSAQCVNTNGQIQCQAKAELFTDCNYTPQDIQNTNWVNLDNYDMTYTSMDDCNKHCAENVAYTVFYGKDSQKVEWRKKLFGL